MPGPRIIPPGPGTTIAAPGRAPAAAAAAAANIGFIAIPVPSHKFEFESSEEWARKQETESELPGMDAMLLAKNWL